MSTEVKATTIKPYHPDVPREEMENLYKLQRENRQAASKLILISAINALNRQIEGEVSGTNIAEPLYRKPEKIAYAIAGDYNYVNLKFDGVVYRNLRSTNGSLGFMPDRSTVVIQHSDHKYYKLYFNDADVLPAGTKI